MNLTHRSRLLTRIAVLLLLSLFCALTPQAARAALIPVDTVDYGIVVDGDCSLVEAIIAANTNTSNDCPAGDDAPVDTIVLGANITYTLPMSYATYLGPTGLPSITSTIVISGNNSTIERDSAEQFGLMHVSAITGTLTLHDLTLRNGHAPSGGAIANEGTLTVINSEIVSNTAGSGGGIYNNGGTLTFINSALRSNYGFGSGGGLSNVANGTATLAGSQVISNFTQLEYLEIGSGGGIRNSDSTLILTDTYVISNTTGQFGGGIASIGVTSTLRLTNSYVTHNKTINGYPGEDSYGGGIGLRDGTTAIISNTRILFNRSYIGGGISSQQSTLTLINSDIGSNQAPFYGWSGSLTGKGGGIYSEESATTLINSRLVSNSADRRGGGIANVGGTVFITDSQILTNSTNGAGIAEPPGAGGGIYNAPNSVLAIADSYVVSNTALYDSGGGIDNLGTMTVTQSYVVSNTANSGAGINNGENSMLVMRDSYILSNTTPHQEIPIGIGSGIGAHGTALITNTSIMANEGSGINGIGNITVVNSKLLYNERAVYQVGGSKVIEQSCIVGNGDTAVTYDIELEYDGEPIDARNNWWGAVNGPSGVGSGSGDSVGAGVNFTPFLTSALAGCPTLAADFAFEMRAQPLTTLMPGQPVSHTVIITNTGDSEIKNLALTTIDFNGESQSEQISLLPTEVISRVFHTPVSPTITTNRVVTFTATISHALAPTQSASASYNVIVPQLTWSSAAYSVDEETGQFTAMVVLSPTNPYATVMAQARISDTVAENFATVTLSFPPNSSSQPIAFSIEEDNVVPRQIQLTLQNPSGARLGNPSKATLNVDGGAGVDFALSVSGNKQSVVVGESILYTYRITNTGEITLTVSNAIDNHVGVVAGLIGTLAPGATHTATASYTVKAEDTSPLENEIVVTASDGEGNSSIRSTTASVVIADEFRLSLPGIRLQD